MPPLIHRIMPHHRIYQSQTFHCVTIYILFAPCPHRLQIVPIGMVYYNLPLYPFDMCPKPSHTSVTLNHLAFHKHLVRPLYFYIFYLLLLLLLLIRWSFTYLVKHNEPYHYNDNPNINWWVAFVFSAAATFWWLPCPWFAARATERYISAGLCIWCETTSPHCFFYNLFYSCVFNNSCLFQLLLFLFQFFQVFYNFLKNLKITTIFIFIRKIYRRK